MHVAPLILEQRHEARSGSGAQRHVVRTSQFRALQITLLPVPPWGCAKSGIAGWGTSGTPPSDLGVVPRSILMETFGPLLLIVDDKFITLPQKNSGFYAIEDLYALFCSRITLVDI